MKLDPFLSKAARLAKKRDYEGALKFLKTEEDRYTGSFVFYNLYGVISLYCGSFVEAKQYLESARRIKMKDTSALLGLAVLYLRRMKINQAVDYYLDILEYKPKNKTAKKALSIIRSHSSPELLSTWISPERLAKLFPPIPSPAIDAKVVLKTALIVSVSLILLSGLLIFLRVLPSPFKTRSTRPTQEFILSNQERSDPVETGGSYMYILTRDQAIDLYDKALSLFSAYRDEAAKVNINRLLNSNASESIKNKSLLLLSFMEVPGFDNFNRNDNPSFEDVKNEPAVYSDVHVIWRGMATNLEITDDYIRFDLLVGYDTRRTLEGIVPVIFDSIVAVNLERPLEVLGKIVLTASYLDIILEGVAIHQSGRLE